MAIDLARWADRLDVLIGAVSRDLANDRYASDVLDQLTDDLADFADEIRAADAGTLPSGPVPSTDPDCTDHLSIRPTA